MKFWRLAFVIGVSSILCSRALADVDAAFLAYTKADYATAFKLYHERALKGDVTAEGMLGSLYAYGRGTARDDVQAVYWFRKIAEQGIAGGQMSLGAMYLQGRGVSYDPAEAARWLRKAAEQDDYYAQYLLSTLYEQGLGVSKDAEQAAYWKTKFDNYIQKKQGNLLPSDVKRKLDME